MTTTRAQENTSTKKARLEIRVTAEQKELIEQAAAVNGRSTTDFVVSVVQEAANRTLREYERMSLTRRDSEAFVRALIDAPAPSSHLKAAARRYKRSVAR